MKLKKSRKAPIKAVVQRFRVPGTPALFPEMTENPWFTGPRPVFKDSSGDPHQR